MDITFLGAAGTVTGSKYLVTFGQKRVLIDCGLFQGFKALRLRNREPLQVDPSEIDAVILTHAHLDHSGYLPLLVRDGFTGLVYCTPATRDLCAILLADSGHLQEEEANYANRHGYSKHEPALPLYTERDAVHSLGHLHPVPYETEVDLGSGLSFRFRQAGHLLGAAMVSLHGPAGHILFSGDLGRPNDPLLPPPASVPEADFLVVESTYGNRTHLPGDPLAKLGEIVRETAGRGGVVLIPSFAVGRAQYILYLLHQLRMQDRIPRLPVFLDSPMAGRATDVYLNHASELRLSPGELAAACGAAESVETVAESKRVDAMTYPRIVISASGMATGGRVLHHLKVMAPDPRNTILFAGYQAGGTRGAALVGGASAVKIHGAYVHVRAEVAQLESLSAHADAGEILHWLERFDQPVRETFITHGEPAAADALRHRIEETLGWPCHVPDHRDRVELNGGEAVGTTPRLR
jgi:metallo-beta-lactamase family protein